MILISSLIKFLSSAICIIAAPTAVVLWKADVWNTFIAKEIMEIKYTYFLVSKAGIPTLSKADLRAFSAAPSHAPALASILTKTPTSTHPLKQEQALENWKSSMEALQNNEQNKGKSQMSLYDRNGKKQYKCSVPLESKNKKWVAFDPDCLIYKIKPETVKVSQILNNKELIKNKSQIQPHQLYVLALNDRLLRKKFKFKNNLKIDMFENQNHDFKEESKFLSLDINYQFQEEGLTGLIDKSIHIVESDDEDYSINTTTTKKTSLPTSLDDTTKNCQFVYSAAPCLMYDFASTKIKDKILYDTKPLDFSQLKLSQDTTRSLKQDEIVVMYVSRPSVAIPIKSGEKWKDIHLSQMTEQTTTSSSSSSTTIPNLYVRESKAKLTFLWPLIGFIDILQKSQTRLFIVD